MTVKDELARGYGHNITDRQCLKPRNTTQCAVAMEHHQLAAGNDCRVGGKVRVKVLNFNRGGNTRQGVFSLLPEFSACCTVERHCGA